jgi:Holliday junction resolvasome RuvABC endonuclease subunit
MLLSLDLATSTGWAVFAHGQRLSQGLWKLTPGRHESAGMRFVKLRSSLNSILAGFPELSLVAFEEVAGHKGTSAAHIYGGLVAILLTWCRENGIEVTAIPVGTVKKRATGKGNAGKPAMIAAANEMWGLNLGAKDHDIADACWVGQCAVEMYSL